MIKVAKLKISHPVNVTWKEFNTIMTTLDDMVFRIKNKAVDAYRFADGNATERWKVARHHVKAIKYSKGLTTDLLVSDVTEGAVKMAVERIKALQKEVTFGTAVYPSFKKGQSIPIRRRGVVQLDASTFSLSLISKKGAEHFGVERIKRGKAIRIDVQVTSKKGYAWGILSKLLSGEYTLKDGSSITKDGRDYYLAICYDTPEVKQHAVSADKILGIDLGIVRAVQMAVGDSPKNFHIDGGEIESFRRRIEQQRVSKRNQLRVASHNRRGHGRKTLLKPLETLSSKIDNFKDTTNWRYANKIVDYAIKNGCGTIQMEDLSGVSKRNTFLTTWSYYDLQTKIGQKAAENGIEVVKVAPAYTSQRCSKCGVIDGENRKSQSVYKCSNCDHEINADLNAARNIAIPDIENEIIAQCKAQGLPHPKLKRK